MNQSDQPLSYRDAGVDIDSGNALIDRIKPLARATSRPEVMGNLGGFGALCRIPKGYENPILVSGTDGVGTKLKIAIDSGRHGSVGIDLVAMCVNDLLATGAEPLFFLDYYATGSLDVEVATSVIEGIAKGCELAGAALVGGETAEMPGMYSSGDYDLAGFCVGVVEESKIITGTAIAEGHKLIALASSGAHSNGYSLIRKIIERAGVALDCNVAGQPLIDLVIEPTKIYVQAVLSLSKQLAVDGVAHITGGGLTENIPRVLPQDVSAKIDLNSWQLPPLFKWLREQGNVSESEMLRTFNCGVGMVLAIPASDCDEAITLLNAGGETAWCIGEIVKADLDEHGEPSEISFAGQLS